MIDTTELRRLHAESSAGEWAAVENSHYCEIRHDGGKEHFEQIGDMCASVHIGILDSQESKQGNRALSTANATFCATAHNVMPALCDELDSARARIAELEADRERLLGALILLSDDGIENSRDPRTKIAREASAAILQRIKNEGSKQA